MPVKYIPYYPNTVEGQAVLDNITCTQRVLRYRENDKVYDRIKRGMPYYEVEKLETVGEPSENLVIRGERISACAYLKEQGIKLLTWFILIRLLQVAQTMQKRCLSEEIQSWLKKLP